MDFLAGVSWAVTSRHNFQFFLLSFLLALLTRFGGSSGRRACVPFVIRMANVTDPFAEAVHGTNPQNLIEKITRLKIYDSLYWKEQCFGLTAETIIDKAVMLKYCGGIYGGNVKPTPFLCLTLKLLQLQPEKEIVYEFIKNEDVRILVCT